MPATADERASEAVFSYSEMVGAKTKTVLSFSPDACFPRVGEHFLGFDLVGELGAGTFGRVYLARQPAIGDRLVALKVASDIGGECQALSQLRHTNIVPIYSVHEDASRPHWKALCMPYLGGTTLQSILCELRSAGTPQSGSAMAASWRKLKTTVRNHLDETVLKPAPGGAPPSSEKGPANKPRLARALTTFERMETETFVDAVLEVAAALADGLAHAHDQGILHRDLKPANVIITDDGEPMLVDFNLSEDVKQRSDSMWSMAGGTLPYMSPEQIDEYLRQPAEVGPRSDLYSLGVMLFELLTGKLPFPSTTSGASVWEDARVAREQPAPSARRLNKAVSRRVDAVIGKCLASDPDDRYESARALHEDIKCCLAGRPLVHARDPFVLERVGQWAERHATRLLAGGLTAFAAFCAFSVHSLNAFEARREAAVAWASARPALDRSRFDLAEAVIDRDSFERVRTKAIEQLGLFSDGDSFESNRRFQGLGAEERQELQTRAMEIAVLAAGASLIEAATQDGDERSRSLQSAARWVRRIERAAGQPPAKTTALLRASLAEVSGAEGWQALRRDADETKPADPADAQLAAVVYASQRCFDAAKALLIEYEQRSSDPLFAAFLSGFCFREAGEVAQAVRAWEFCAKARPTTPQFRRLIGLTEHRFPKVVRNLLHPLRNLDAAVAMDPTDSESLLARALVYKTMNKHPDAMQDARDALRLGFSPYYAWSALKRIASAIPSTKQTENDVRTVAEAEAALQKEAPKSVEDWLELAQYGATSQVRLAACEKALEIRPWSIDANAAYLEQLLAAGETGARAVGAVERARRVAPDLWRIRELCGRLLAHEGLEGVAFDEARQILAQPSFKRQRVSAATAVCVGVLQRKPGEANRAAELLQAALRERKLTVKEWGDALNADLRSTPQVAELSKRLADAPIASE